MIDDAKLLALASQFSLEGDVTKVKRLGEGFINDTFVIVTEGDAPDYILQRKNHNVFPDVPSMMDNIWRVTNHIKAKVAAEGGDPMREVLTVIPTKEGKLYTQDDEGNYWAVCIFIKDSVTYDRADTPELAYKGGQGMGRFQAYLADFTEPLAETIKGFHNIRYRFEQWDDVISRDPVGRVAEVQEEIGWIESRREQMLDFWSKVERGELPMRVTHNDTKLSNILFDKSGDVLCVIDLDTCMNSTSLNDVGDALRSYTNTGAEDDKNLDNVSMSMEMYQAYIDGYLSERRSTLTQTEIDLLPFSGIYITYEQVLRFLMDYIDGDNYYRIAYPDHNLVRTRAQYKLLISMESQLL
jgi:hypothetical protein